MKKIYVFSLETCQRCKSLKTSLQQNNIEFTEIDTISNNDLWVEVAKQTKSNIVPTIFVGEENGDNTEGFIYVPGRDFITDEELIEKLKN